MSVELAKIAKILKDADVETPPEFEEITEEEDDDGEA